MNILETFILNLIKQIEVNKTTKHAIPKVYRPIGTTNLLAALGKKYNLSPIIKTKKIPTM